MLLDQFGQALAPSCAPVASSSNDGISLNRRGFLKAAACVPMILSAQASFAQEEYHPQGFWEQPRTIWMKRPETGEEIFSTYWADGQLIDSEYRKICRFMRDHRMEAEILKRRARGQDIPADWFAVSTMSIILLDILYATGGWLAYHNMARPLTLNSGFRHKVTNAKIENAALNSRHIFAGAGDIGIPGVRPSNVSAYGIWLSGGGVGWYPGKQFTHVDDGRMRFWRG